MVIAMHGAHIPPASTRHDTFERLGEMSGIRVCFHLPIYLSTPWTESSSNM